MAYDAIVFDMDGVLLEGAHTDRSIYRSAIEETAADFDVDPSDAVEQLINPDDPTVVRSFCDRHDLTAEAFWGYREHAATALENRAIAAGERKPFSDTDVLSDLGDALRLGIVSNNRNGTVRFVRQHFDWRASIDVSHGREPTLAGYARMKPDPYYLDRTLADLDVDPAATLYVGDQATDVMAADRAGTDVALLVRDGDAPEEGPDPTVRIRSLHALTERFDEE